MVDRGNPAAARPTHAPDGFVSPLRGSASEFVAKKAAIYAAFRQLAEWILLKKKNESGGARPTIVALGDSTTAIDDWTGQSIVALGASSTAVDDWTGQAIPMYPELLPGALETYGIAARVHNAGIGDTTTREARERLDRDVRARAPDIVVILFGINDSWIDIDEGRREPRLTRDEYRDNLRHMIATLQADGARVILMTPTPMRWDDPLYLDLFAKNPGFLETCDERGIDRLLDLYAQDARDVARDAGVPLVDLHRAFEEYDRQPGQSIRDLLLAGDGIHPNARGQELICDLLAAEIASAVGR